MRNNHAKILICGDVHGNFWDFNHLLSEELPVRPDVVLQCGDFGYFPHEVHGGDYPGARKHRPFNLRRLQVPEGTELFWCDGNHEDHATLSTLVSVHGHEGPIKMKNARGCYYMPRGSTLTLEDGRVVLFLGGAFSVDHEMRRAGRDWWPEEILEPSVLDRIPDDLSVDIVISHTGPSYVVHYLQSFLPPMPSCWDKSADPSVFVLQQALERFRPKLWYFGHFHTYWPKFEMLGCEFVALANIESCNPNHFYAWLPEK